MSPSPTDKRIAHICWERIWGGYASTDGVVVDGVHGTTRKGVEQLHFALGKEWRCATTMHYGLQRRFMCAFDLEVYAGS